MSYPYSQLHEVRVCIRVRIRFRARVRIRRHIRIRLVISITLNMMNNAITVIPFNLYILKTGINPHLCRVYVSCKGGKYCGQKTALHKQHWYARLRREREDKNGVTCMYVLGYSVSELCHVVACLVAHVWFSWRQL